MLKSIHYLNEQGKRKNIEDSLYPLPGHAALSDRVFIVCDGVGGEQKGDYILLCTDGLPENISEKELKSILHTKQTQNDKRALMMAYCEHQTNDNYSMYLIELGSSVKKQHSKKIVTMLTLTMLLAFLLYCFYHFRGQKSVESTHPTSIEISTADSVSTESNPISLPVLQKTGKHKKQ